MLHLTKDTGWPVDRILESLRWIMKQQEYRVRKRRDEGELDPVMMTEYRIFAVACAECGRPVGKTHRPTCSRAGGEVWSQHTKDW